MQEITRMAAKLTMNDVAHLEGLLKRKLTYIPDHVLSALTINDILLQTPQALSNAGVPPDLHLPFFLRNRTYIDRHGERPIKDGETQSLDITRAIFFYHLNEAHQFQRYHDLSRWNQSLFTALLSTSANSKSSQIKSPVHSSRRSRSEVSKTEHVTPAARRFMTSYLAAILERHNTPRVFNKREEFIRRWKESRWDMFEHLGAAQRKLLKKQTILLNRRWEFELDRAIERMGRNEYDRWIALFVGSIILGRKDQGLPASAQVHLLGFERSASPPLEAMQMDQGHDREGKNELLEALRVPIGERRKQDYEYVEQTETPADMRYAITCMQNVSPADMLPTLMQLFPVADEGTPVEPRAAKEKRSRWDLT